MPKKSAAEKAAKEATAQAVAVEAARQETEKKRMMWAGLFLAAVAVFAGGYAVGHSSDDTLVAASSMPAIVPGGGQGVIQGGVVAGQGFVPGQGVLRGQGGIGRGMGQGGMQGQSPGMGMGPGLGPNGSGLPGRGNIERIPGQGPYGQNFPGECPFGIYQPDPGDTTPVFAAPGFLGVGVNQTPQGVLVTEIAADSPAFAAGIEVDDLIVGLDGTPVTTVGQFSQLVRIAGEGATVEVTVLRSGGEVTLVALLGTTPG